MRVLCSDSMRWVCGGHTDSFTGIEDNCGYDNNGNWIGDPENNEGDAGDGWWGNVLESIGDVIGLDGSFGYDGEQGREWIWDNWGENINGFIDDLGSFVEDFFEFVGELTEYIWNVFSGFVEGIFEWIDPTTVTAASGGSGSPVPGVAVKSLTAYNPDVSGPVPENVSMNDLRSEARKTTDEIRKYTTQKEHGLFIYELNGVIGHGKPYHGDSHNVPIGFDGVPDGAVIKAWNHSHTRPSDDTFRPHFPSAEGDVKAGDPWDWQNVDKMITGQIVPPRGITFDSNVVTYIYDVKTQSTYEYDINDRDTSSPGERIYGRPEF